jgi:hypothetical protein
MIEISEEEYEYLQQIKKDALTYARRYWVIRDLMIYNRIPTDIKTAIFLQAGSMLEDEVDKIIAAKDYTCVICEGTGLPHSRLELPGATVCSFCANGQTCTLDYKFVHKK